ncbi:MAG TPA: hypothetical protein VFC16_01915 [Nakamurella sp.]|jgi:hypothetical protein|nr:hypothetical protein [Nakamurella sp.]
MPISAELQALQRAIADLRSGLNALAHKCGEMPIVARLRNDLERLILDVADVEAMSPASYAAAAAAVAGSSGVAQPAIYLVSDEPYDPSLWREDADDEGVGGYHGIKR